MHRRHPAWPWLLVLLVGCTGGPGLEPPGGGGDRSGIPSPGGMLSDPTTDPNDGTTGAGTDGLDDAETQAPDAGTSNDGGVRCLPTRLTCRVAEPSCGDFEVPSYVGNCYGPCVPIGDCPCAAPDDCPDRNQYTCVQTTGRCSPYL